MATTMFDNEVKANTGKAIFDPLIFNVDPQDLPTSSEFSAGTMLVRRRTTVFEKQDTIVKD